MDTITINTKDALNEKEKEKGKKKLKVSDTAKIAMAAGAAGVVGAAAVDVGMSMSDDVTEEADEIQASVSDNHRVQQENVVAETEITDNEVVEINPEDVMLEEPSKESDVTAGTQPQHNESEEYQPFANNDKIGDDVLPDPSPEEILFAENTSTDVVVEDSTVDMICSVNPEESVITEEISCLEDDLYADNSSTHVESDIDSDLMA